MRIINLKILMQTNSEIAIILSSIWFEWVKDNWAYII